MTQEQFKNDIKFSLQEFASGNLTSNALKLFQLLGYITERQAPLHKTTFAEFKDTFIDGKKFDESRARVSEWKYVDLLFQLSKEEVLKQTSLFDTKQVDRTVIETYLFFVIELNKDQYSRTELSLITREVNCLFPMPAMILFRHSNSLTLSVINRRLHKRDECKDVLEKVTLIKDISISKPHRAHIEILFDLSFEELKRKHQFTNFVELHNAWQKTLDIKELNKRFFQELANWYFWATQKVSFPDDAENDKDIRNATGIIRVITRLMFVWFLKEKNLVPDDLFDEKKLKKLLKYTDKNKSTYYKAILQNLFFATLNTEMGKRKFRSTAEKGRDAHFFIHNLFRYESEFVRPKETLEKYFDPIPFLNGGLFECLDKEIEEKGILKRIRIDGFSDREDNVLKVPDEIFFCEKEKTIDLSNIYGTPKKSKEKVRGLIDILNSYKFTITENTPIEEEVALDPELLGKVFENLLANYNPETKTTARKQTGSFYTPREIVNYMVDESLIAYFKQQFTDENSEENIRDLLSYSEKEITFSASEKNILIHAIDTIKIVDPACGSGAFPMGILHKLVHVLHKVDPKNELWEQRQIEKVDKLIKDADSITDTKTREKVIDDLEETKNGVVEAFENNELDYGRKLYLIENCIYGVDIQPIAVQISKLRFFISLIVEQRTNPKKENLGVRPLPNLETKFVAANTLIGLEKESANLFTNPEIEKKKEQLKKIRHKYFEARTPKTKEKCRNDDKKLRDELAELLVTNHDLQPATARKIVEWNPYNQNASASFFDMEWMFGLKDGFDVVIGNPPYVSANNMTIHDRNYFNASTQYLTLKGKWDLYVVFTEKSLVSLKPKGLFIFIIPFGFLNQPFAESLREFILKNYKLISIVDLHSNKIFESATVPSCIPLIQRNESKVHKVNILEFKEYKFLIKYQIDIQKYAEGNQHMFRTEDLNQKSGLLQKIKESGKFLETYFYTSTGAEIHGKESRALDGTTISGKSKFDVLHKQFSKGFKPYIEGSAIQKSKEGRYSFPLIDTWLDYSKIDEMRSPKFKQLFDSKKIIIRRSSGLLRILAIYDTQKIYTSEKCILIICKSDLPKSHSRYEKTSEIDLKYLLGIINCRLIDFYYESVYGGFIDVYPNNLKELPIKIADLKIQNQFISIVNYILLLKKQHKDSNFFERLIDAMVYELYLPEAIQAASAEVLKYLTNLPVLNEGEDEKNLKTIEKVYQELSNQKHPVSLAMFKMDTIEEIAIIEGKK